MSENEVAKICSEVSSQPKHDKMPTIDFSNKNQKISMEGN